MSVRARHKAQVYTLVADLHAAGVTTRVIIAEILGISESYVRTVLADLRLKRARTAGEALAKLDTQLRLRIAELRNSQ